MISSSVKVEPVQVENRADVRMTVSFGINRLGFRVEYTYMGNWIDIRFQMKPTLVDEAFLKKMDDCFAQAGCRPSVVGYPEVSVGNTTPSERLEAMERLAWFESDGFPVEKLASAFLGYSTSDEEDQASVHVWLLVWQVNRYVDRFMLKTHTDYRYFQPDCVVDECQSDEGKLHTQKCKARAAMVRLVAPIIHEQFGAYYTEALQDHSLERLFIIANVKEHVLPFFDGRTVETFKLYETPEGKWICPVCGEAHLTPPLWFQSGNPETPWAEASFQKCPTCHTQYGVDDNLLRFPDSEENQVGIWDKLQREWLRRKAECLRKLTI